VSAPRLSTLNPLAKIAATAPAIVALLFVRDAATPAAFLVLAYAVMLAGLRPAARTAWILLLGLPAAMVVIGLSFAIWADPARVDRSVVVLQVGAWTLYGGALEVGAASALRLGAIAALALVSGLSTTGADLARASVQHLRLPYRVGYTALAAFRFVPRFASELELIRRAHRVRGARGGPWPFGAVVRAAGYVVPLLAGAIRHAERVALAMDARAFGAFPTRTERHLVPLRRRDLVFVIAFSVSSAALFAAWWPWSAR
jgi:energy-coupling factor transport system permease protein